MKVRALVQEFMDDFLGIVYQPEEPVDEFLADRTRDFRAV